MPAAVAGSSSPSLPAVGCGALPDVRVAEQLWTISGPIAPLFGATQPWIKGYNGEEELGPMNWADVFACLWVDQRASDSLRAWVNTGPPPGGLP